MLAERVVEWTEQWKQQGLQQGKQQGRVEILLRQLELKFGPAVVTAVDRRRVEQADSATLQRWLEKILLASTIEDVFAC